MISTVTTTTVTTVTTVTLAGTLGFFLVATLAVCLIKKEMFASQKDTPWAQNLSKALNIAIVPLLMVFVLLAADKLMEIFS